MHQVLCGRESALDVARADHRFVKARREPSAAAAAGLLFAASKARAFRESQLPADLCERRRRHKSGAKRGERTLGRIGKRPIEVLAAHEIDDGIAEERE